MDETDFLNEKEIASNRCGFDFAFFLAPCAIVLGSST
jgi:hypothetical protein